MSVQLLEFPASNQTLTNTANTLLERLRVNSEEEFAVNDIGISPEFDVYLYRILSPLYRSPVSWRLKRALDMVLSLMGLLVLLPLFLLIGLCIKFDSPGPVLFKQVRVGKLRKPFTIWKFRTMTEGAEAQLTTLLDHNDGNEVMFKHFNDPRITRIGHFLRRYSLDELPQLFNVLKGDMSLVGPRPGVEREVKLYKRWHHGRLVVEPGMTGLWQTQGRSEIKSFDQVASLDLDYIANWNLAKDVRLLMNTIPVVVSGRGSA